MWLVGDPFTCILFQPVIHAVSRLCPDQILKPLNHRRCVAGMCMLYKIHSYPKHCLYCELPPACQRVRHTRAAAVAHPCELEVPRCRTSQFGRCFLPAHVRMWNDLPSSVFDSGTLNGFKGAVNRSLLLWRLFSFFSVVQVLVGLLCNFVNVLFFPLGLASLILIIKIIYTKLLTNYTQAYFITLVKRW